MPLRRKSSADASTFGIFKCNSETRVPFVDGWRTRALLVSIVRHVGFFLTLASSDFAAAAFTISAKVKLPWLLMTGTGVGGDGVPERRLLGLLSSFNGGGGPTFRTVVKAEAMAVSKGRCGRADMVAVVTAATCLVNKGSSCQKGWEEGGDGADWSACSSLPRPV